jgi:hypothetical protein
MKIGLVLFLTFSLIAFASEKYGVYDSKGSRISAFEAEQYELSEKTQQIKAAYPNNNLFISSMQKGKGSKPLSRYRYKAETGAYIGAVRKETFTVCPDKEIQGTWISEHSVYLNAQNCVSVQAPNLAGTFRILFLENSGRTDTIQVLVEQSYIQMGDYSHKIWVTELEYNRCFSSDVCAIGPWWDSRDEKNWRYENRNYSQPLVVDKTMLTMGDAWYYNSKNESITLFSGLRMKYYLENEYKNEKLEESRLPFALGDAYDFALANERSKKEGLDTAYRTFYRSSYNGKEIEKLVILSDTSYFSFFAVDTSASGYRVPFDDEWFFLMRAGASTRYYWGDEEDSKIVSRYEWINPIGLKPVAKLQPNGFGLYDMMGIAKEYCYGKRADNSLSPERTFIKEIGALEQYMAVPNATKECEKIGDADWKCTEIEQTPILQTSPANYTGLRFLRKTPKLQKLKKF